MQSRASTARSVYSSNRHRLAVLGTVVVTVFIRLSVGNAEPLPKRTTDVVSEADADADTDTEPSLTPAPNAVVPPPPADTGSSPPSEISEPPNVEEPATPADKPPTTLPGQAHGIAKREEQPRQLWLWPLRVVLFVPRLALEIVDAPIRGALWAYEGYDIGPRTRQIFFNEDGTIGMYPVAFTETGFGANVGLRFVHRELFGKEEKLNLRASFGGRYRQLYRAKISSGRRWPFEVVVKSELEIRPKDAYFGVGHSFDAVRSRFSQTVSRSIASTNIELTKNLSLELGGAYTYRKFNTSVPVDDNEPVLSIYPDDVLVGITEGVSAMSSLTRLSFDTRRSVSQYESDATPSLGWLVSGFASSVRSLDSKPSDYIRVGADVQTYQRLAEGPRVLVLRANYNQVIGDREDIPFTDLPRLGGAIMGRGFHRDRFRDKASLLMSAEYQFDLSHMVQTALFVDYGRVAPRARDLVTEIDDYALGGGMALQFHTAKSFIVRATLAGSQEGAFFNVSFDPQFGPTEILEQN